MGYLVRIGEKKPEEAPKREPALAARAAEWRESSPARRAQIGLLVAAILVGGFLLGVQALPSLRAALFPVASRDLPADADPSPFPTREDAGVYDRTVPDGVKLPGSDKGGTPVVDDPSEKPFERGAPR
jgi:hypothetical protein